MQKVFNKPADPLFYQSKVKCYLLAYKWQPFTWSLTIPIACIYPAADGFSPRNVRRMRAFYAAYEESPEIMRLAMHLGWTQNVAILEGCGSNEERAWYIRATLRFGWKKAKLLAAIESQAWLYSSLDEQAISC